MFLRVRSCPSLAALSLSGSFRYDKYVIVIDNNVIVKFVGGVIKISAYMSSLGLSVHFRKNLEFGANHIFCRRGEIFIRSFSHCPGRIGCRVFFRRVSV